MKPQVRTLIRTLVRSLASTLGAILLVAASAAHADVQMCPKAMDSLGGGAPEFKYDITLSPYTVHWHPSEQHKPVVLAGIHQYVSADYFCGFSVFSNSFGQPSATVYVGKVWNNIWPSQPKVYGKVAAGLMYGYVGEFQHKVPLNYKGFSPLVVPTAGYRYNRQDSIELQLLGNSALMFSYVHRY